MKIDASEKIKRIQSILSENKQDFKKTFYHYSLFDLFMYLTKVQINWDFVFEI